MLGKSVQRVLRRPVLALTTAASDPLEAWAAFQDRNAEHREGPTPPDLYKAGRRLGAAPASSAWLPVPVQGEL